MFKEDLTTFFDIEGFAVNATFEHIIPPKIGSSISCYGNWLSSSGEGCVVIFNKQDEDWKQTQILHGSQLNQDFGYSISINGDYLAVSSPSLNTVHIFKNVNSVWTHVFNIEQDDSTGNDLFGNSVSVIGSYVVIASKGHNSNQGAVYTFLRNVNDEFTQIDKIEDPLLSFFGKKIVFDGIKLFVQSEHSVDCFSFLNENFEHEKRFELNNDPTDISYYNKNLIIFQKPSFVIWFTNINNNWYRFGELALNAKNVSIYDRVYVTTETRLYEYTIGFSLISIYDISVISISSCSSGVFFGTSDFQIYDYVKFLPIEYTSKITTNVIFDHEHVSVSNADLVYDGYKPTILCKTSDVYQFDYGSLVTVENTVFKIISKQQDGTGVSTIILHKGS
jgi:hypothetical protein